MSKGKNIALWVIAGLLGLAFVAGGVMKLVTPSAAEGFAHFGLPGWFRFLIGASELAGGIGLLLPPVRFLAALGLEIIMVGAFVCHVRAGDPASHAITVVVFVALIGLLAWMRRPTGSAAPARALSSVS